jgi:hypothetical protein
MAFPPRSRSSRAEPSIAPAGPAARDPVTIRPVASRPAASKPLANDAGLDREAARFSAEHRRGVDPASLSLTEADRVIISSSTAGGSERRESGFSFFRVLGFAVLLVLAAIGAYNVYHSIAPFLPWAS